MSRVRIPEDVRELILKCLACGVSASRIKEITGYEMETIKKLKGNYASHYKELCADYENGKFIADGVTDELAALVISSVLDGNEQEEDEEEPTEAAKEEAPKEEAAPVVETSEAEQKVQESKPSELKTMLKRLNDLYEMLQWAMGSMTTDASKQGCREVLKEIRRMRVERYCKYVDWREIEEKL